MTHSRGASRRDRIVLAYAGDLESSVAIPWLAETAGAEVVTATLDFGQSRDLEGTRDRALALGAVRAHVLDVREPFARDYLLPALKASALYDGGRCLVGALGHAAIAARLVEIAGIEQAERVAHGGVTSAARLSTAVHSMKPALTVMAPAAEWGFGRAELLEYAAARRLPVPTSDSAGGVRLAANAGATRASEAAVVDITFKAGTPVAINSVAMPLLDLIGSLDFLAGKNGIGGAEWFDNPAASVLAAAHDALQQLAFEQAAASPGMNGFSDPVGHRYAELVENGSWFSVLRAALDAYVEQTQQLVNGTVRAKLHQGACEIVHRHIRNVQENDGYTLVRPLRYRA
jgi:argininosuccinate synthase